MPDERTSQENLRKMLADFAKLYIDIKEKGHTRTVTSSLVSMLFLLEEKGIISEQGAYEVHDANSTRRVNYIPNGLHNRFKTREHAELYAQELQKLTPEREYSVKEAPKKRKLSKKALESMGMYDRK